MAGRAQAGCDPWQSDTRRSAWFSAGKSRVADEAEAESQATLLLPHFVFLYRSVISLVLFSVNISKFMIQLEI